MEGDDEPPRPKAVVGRRARTNAFSSVEANPEAEAGGQDSPLAQGGSILSPQGSANLSRQQSKKAFATSGPPGPQQEAAGDKGFKGVSRRKQEQLEREDEGTKIKVKYEEATKDAIFDLPELEEAGREDLSTVVAEAPKVRVHKVQDLGELEADVQFRLPPSDDRDIDLSLLTGVLCSSEQVNEGDEVWELEQLLINVASELTIEAEKLAGEGTEGATQELGPMGMGKDNNSQFLVHADA